MPTYSYSCPNGHTFDLFERKISDKLKSKCPQCGKMATRQISGGSGFHLKGTGFYATDYKSGKPDAGKAAAEKAEGKSEGGKAEGWKTGDGKAEGGKAGGGKTDGGKADKSETKSESKSKPAKDAE